MKIKKTVIGVLAGLTALAPIATTGYNVKSNLSLTVEATQGQVRQMVSLGGSLDANQAAETKRLLGAEHLGDNDTVYVNGDTVNHYLNDGSNASTPVFSSAYIEPKEEGYGVQVQIVTPSNILNVTATTYQNAAITAGAKNALIRIATVTPVTGEGALAGVYAIYEKMGVQLKQEDIQVAEKEIKVVNEVVEAAKLSDEQVNNLMAEIKKQIIAIVSEGSEITDDQINQIIDKVLADNKIENIPSIKELLFTYAKDFAKTEAAKSKETIEQIEQSLDSRPWATVLAGLGEDSARSNEEILANKVEYDGENELLKALINKFYSDVEADENALTLELYAHTFVLEKTSELSPEELGALNALRTAIFEHAVNTRNPLRDEVAQASGYTEDQYYTVKELMQACISDYEAKDAVLQEVITRVALATGYSPEAYFYTQMTQEGNEITFFIQTDEVDHVSTVDVVTYNLETGVVSSDFTGEKQAGSIFDFASYYGIKYEGKYDFSSQIPTDYKIPGYEAEAEQTKEEPETEEAPVEEPIEEEPVEEAAEETAGSEAETDTAE